MRSVFFLFPFLTLQPLNYLTIRKNKTISPDYSYLT